MQGNGTAAWTAAVAAALIATATIETARAADVVVHRGSQVSVESARAFRAKASGGVAVQRGQAVARKPAPPKKGTGRFVTATGEDLWIIDRQRNRVINCGIEGSSNVGGERIGCARRSIKSILK